MRRAATAAALDPAPGFVVPVSHASATGRAPPYLRPPRGSRAPVRLPKTTKHRRDTRPHQLTARARTPSDRGRTRVNPMQDENDTPAEEHPAADADTAEPVVAEEGAAPQAEAASEPEEPSEVANTIAKMGLTRMSLQELKDKAPADLLAFAELFEIENANSMRKQDMMFSILKTLAEEGVEISGSGTLEVVQDGFGFLRSPEANYLPGPDDIYVSPSQIRKFGLRTGDTVDGAIRAPREGERYFALVNVQQINFENPDNVRHKVLFDNLTPLYPDERLVMELPDPTVKDRTGRVIDIVAPLGKGQRCLITSPPRVGKTVMLQNIAKSIETNHPECYLIVLLVDERPEEVTD